MLIILLVKAVPSRTTRVQTVGGVLHRETMELVLNPYDEKGVLAADFLRRRVGGKVVAISMGPAIKLEPLMSKLRDMAVLGVDENVVLSDGRMAGADTMATAYALSMGITRILDHHTKALDELIGWVEDSNLESLEDRPKELYEANLLVNGVYSTLPPIRNSIIGDFRSGRRDKKATLDLLRTAKNSIKQFVVVAGLRSTDGETGSVGPQVAEALSDELGITIPHITNIHDLDLDPDSYILSAERKIGEYRQKLESSLPLVITVSPDFKARVIPASTSRLVRENSFLGSVTKPSVWDGQSIRAKPDLLGLLGSPTIVGPGIETGRPQVQKFLNSSFVFVKPSDKISFEGRTFGPFIIGDTADNLPKEVRKDLLEKVIIEIFRYPRLVGELFDLHEK